MKEPETSLFESRAKLMMSGEYLVLKGALSLALPLKFGQVLKVTTHEGNPLIKWESYIRDQLWFSATFQLPDFRVSVSNSTAISETLRQVLISARKLNPGFVQIQQQYRVTSEMDFSPEWGFGSGSSLISNVAFWAECDPFRLNKMIFNGSGYDIACARSSSPIIYKTSEDKPFWRNADFQPNFHKHLYFVYLNHKQNSKKSIGESDLSAVSTRDIDAITALTIDLEKSSNLQDFQLMIDQHEEITGKIIRQTPVKKMLFNDFEGSVKSLGAWGGDFILAASEASDETVRKYFAGKNLTTIYNYHEIVLNRPIAELALTTTNNPRGTLQMQNS